MKRCTLILYLVFFGITHQALTAQSFNQELATVLENMKTYTLQIADQMPAGSYGFKPVDGMMTFEEQLKHLTWMLHLHVHFVLEDHPLSEYQEEMDSYYQKMEGLSKEALLTFSGAQFDETIAYIRTMKSKRLNETFHFTFLPGEPKKSIRTFLMTIRDHITHHRAQMIVYLRMRGITPAQYALF